MTKEGRTEVRREGSRTPPGRSGRGLSRIWGLVAGILLLAVFVGTPSASAEIVDTYVLRFASVPSFVNLNFTSAIEVEIGTSYGAGQDNYLVTVTAPSGRTSAVWYNFTGLGTLARVYGDDASDFAALIDQVGSYTLRLEHFDGAAFAPAAYAMLVATDRLFVTVEAASASNEYTDVHNCPIAQEFQRGGEVIARAYVYYASNGEFVNGTDTPSANGNITGTAFGLTQTLRWQNVYHFWRWAWFPAWDQAIGVFNFTAQASDGQGNHGTGYSPEFGLTAWKINPAILKVVPRILNGTGSETVTFQPGDTVVIAARVTYEGHNAHNRAFPGPLNATRGGAVTAVLGYGPYNASSGQFGTTLATLTMAHDAVTENWTATYQVKATDSLRSDLQVVIKASDGTSPSNTGSSFTTRFAFQPVEETPPPPPPAAAPGIDPLYVGILAVVALVAGTAIGVTISRRRRVSPAAPKKEEEPEDEWVVEEEKGGQE